MNNRVAKLAFEDGLVLEGVSFGATGEASGEVVFNTAMAGYQEILTDPSYKGQMVTMTYPLIGNYGVNKSDEESARPFAEALIVKELSSIASNWRSEQPLDEYMLDNGVMGIEDVDTRAITRHIRLAGAMKAVLSTDDLDDKSIVAKAKASPGLVGLDLVKEVACEKAYEWHDPIRGMRHTAQADGRGLKVVAVDCGIKFNMLRILAGFGCHVSVVPANTTAPDILAMKPHGVLFSNGPGDPAAVTYVVDAAKGLLGKVPVFGICLGHQMLGQAFGGRTYKLKFGHHGGNHPVRDTKTGKVSITVQNHGFSVDIDSLPRDDVEITHMNLNDGTLEGMRHNKYPAFSVQFHPECSPGPHDAMYLFDEFIEMMRK